MKIIERLKRKSTRREVEYSPVEWLVELADLWELIDYLSAIADIAGEGNDTDFDRERIQYYVMLCTEILGSLSFVGERV